MSYEYFTSDELPALPPGYHFTISFTEVRCTQEQLDAIQQQLIKAAAGIIREHRLSDAAGEFIKTRLAAYRTAPLLDEQAPEQSP
jgi:hypothetical protein